MFTTVGGIADQLLVFQINDKVEKFERNLPNQNGDAVGNLRDIERTIPSLNHEPGHGINIGC